MDGPLSGQTALVTGGAKRLGRQICIRLAEAGCDVVIHHRDSAKEAHALASSLRQSGVQAFELQADLAKAADRARLLARADALAGRPVRFLVNNASAFPRASVADLSASAFDEVLRVNAWAPFDLARQLADGRKAAVVNLLDARLGDPDFERIGYHFSKALLQEMTRVLALGLAPKVRVNAVSPGPVLVQVDAPEGTPPPTGRTLPLKAPPSPDDVADAVLYLLTAPSVTGTILPVDGGRHLPPATS